MTHHPDSNSAAEQSESAAASKIIRIIGIAMLAGVLGFLGVVLAMKGVQNKPIAAAGIFTWLALFVGISLFVVSLVMPRVVSQAQLNQILAGSNQAATTDQMAGVFRAKSIIGMALAEGGAFFNLIAYLIEGQLINVGVVALLATRIATQLPSLHTIENWVSDQRQRGFADSADT